MTSLHLLAAGLAAALAAAQPRPVLLTTDAGADMDDQWALAHLALSPEFDLRGVVTTHTGKHKILPDPAAESTARVAREVLDRMPLKIRPQVIPGSSLPLAGRTEPRRNPGADFLLKASGGFTRDRRLTVLVIGAATDAASALLADPSLAARIEIVAMGFRGWPQGGDEFNIQNDVRAWQVLLDSGVPITVGDGAVTLRDLRMTRERARALFDSRGAPGRYLASLLTDWLDQKAELVRRVTGDPNWWPVWDQVTVAHLLGFTRAETHGRPRLRNDLSFDHRPKPASRITWVTSVDSGRLWADFTSKLDRALARP